MEATLKDRIEQMITSDRVVLFMKGNKLFPQCGFSAQVVHLLKACNAKFTDVNVLTDPELRQGIKEFSEWPTIPQLYVAGAFVGGCDIVSELAEKGELQSLVSGGDEKPAAD
jgi:monothiol glutaredoxin